MTYQLKRVDTLNGPRWHVQEVETRKLIVGGFKHAADAELKMVQMQVEESKKKLLDRE